MDIPPGFLPLSPLAMPCGRRAAASPAVPALAAVSPRRRGAAPTAMAGGDEQPRREGGRAASATAAAAALLLGLVLPSPLRRGGGSPSPVVGGVGAVAQADAKAAKHGAGVPVVMVKGAQRKGVRAASRAIWGSVEGKAAALFGEVGAGRFGLGWSNRGAIRWGWELSIAGVGQDCASLSVCICGM